MRLSVNLKKCVSLLVLAGGLLAVVGCAKESAPPPTNPASPAAAPAGAPAASTPPAEQVGSGDTGAETSNPPESTEGAK